MNDAENNASRSQAATTPFIHRHPWVILVAIFLVLVGAWTTMIIIASKNRPEKVPLEHLEPGHER